MSVDHPKESKPASSRRRSRGPAAALPTSSSPARRQAALILEVLAGVRRPREAAQALGTSLMRYYQLERRALVGLLRACEPAPRGPRPDPLLRVAQLERENQRLQRECDRRQALVRMAERSLGLAAPASARPAVKNPEEPTQNGAKKRRRSRARVRALQVVRGLRADETPDPSASAEPVDGGETRS